MDILPQLVVNSIIAGSIYAMIALGFNLIFGTVKFFDLGYGALATVGGYAAFYFSQTLGLNIWFAAAGGIIVAGLAGFLINKFVYGRLVKNKATSMVLLVASLGVLTAMQAIIAIIFTSQFQTLSGVLGPSKVYEIFGGVITQVQMLILILAVIIMVSLGLVLKFSRFGKAVRAIGDDQQVAEIVGINTARVVGQVFFVGSMIAGLAGILYGLDTGIEPTMGLSLLLKGVIASIIGGIGNVYGGVLGAFLLGFVENFGIWKISGEWKDAIAFVVLILFLLFRPNGLMRK